jgi:tetratricopeptide (TPR) repeat protein
MRPMTRQACSLLCLLLFNPLIYGQLWDTLTNPQVNVTLEHPPGLGIHFERVAFGTPEGQCALEIQDTIITLFVQQGIEVVDRHHLDQILQEHQLNLSGFINQSSAAALGNILGPTTLIFVKGLRCQTEEKALHRDWKDGKGLSHRTYISKTTAYLKTSIQAVDLTTGRIFTAKTFEFSREASQESESGQPDYPEKYQVFGLCLQELQEQVRRLFFSWSETIALVYFDNKKCQLDQAASLVKTGQYQEALRVSLANFDDCQAAGEKPKYLARAQYNIGMTHFILGDYSSALAAFQKAYAIKDTNTIAQGIQMVQDAIRYQQSMAEYEEQITVAAEKATTEQAAPPKKEIFDPESVEGRLARLKNLLDKGIITQQEYDQQRKAILKDL